ncbi:hypothetical protein QEN19_002019 [Hanseniaspora menglaensis]
MVQSVVTQHVSTRENENKKKPKNTLQALLLSNFRLFIFKSTQIYLKNPLKLFKPTKYDTFFYLRVIDNYQHQLHNKQLYAKNVIINNIITNNSLCVIYRSIKVNGLKTIYDKVLPPLIANSISGTILFTTYLTIDKFNSGSVFFNGFVSGIVNTAVTRPLENFYKHKIIANQKEIIDLHKKNKSFIKYIYQNFDKASTLNSFKPGTEKQLLKLIYLREGLSYGIYFHVFESFKESEKSEKSVWKTLSAGLLATGSLQLLNYPLTRLESIINNFGTKNLKSFAKAVDEIKMLEKRSTVSIFYQGFLKNTVSYMPSMTLTLLLLDYLRDTTYN